MTELQKIQRAKMYVDNLANGVNPLTGFRLSEDEIVRDDRVIACLEYISEVLEINIRKWDTETAVQGREEQIIFITEEQKSQLRINYGPCTTVNMVNEINRVIEQNGSKKINGIWINDWLESIGMLARNGFGNRIASPSGREIGITSELKNGPNYGEYYVNMFSTGAQGFVYENLDMIIDYHYNGR